jgi:peptide chain release factor subunit 1
MKDLRGIIIGGPGPIKDMFYKEDHLPTDIKAKVLGVVDTSYTELFGLQETVVRAEDILAEASITRERKLLERFFGELAKDSGLAVYGVRETVKALEMGAVDMLLMSEDFDWLKVSFECPSCKAKLEKFVKRDNKSVTPCPSCGAAMEEGEEADGAEKLSEFADSVGTKVEIVSVDSREGEQLHEMGGIAGILRYSMK